MNGPPRLLGNMDNWMIKKMEKARGLILLFFPRSGGGQKETKHLVKAKASYEKKEYKSAMKEVDNISKINAKKVHKEALALKALMWGLMGNTLEAYKCARASVEENDQSALCLIILGLLFESDFNYEEAIECFRKAVEISSVNKIELLLYFSGLQAIMWDLPAFLESRCRILTLKPDEHLHQIAYAVSHHLNGNYSEALEVLEACNTTPVNKQEKIFFYKISLLEESGNFMKALEELYKKDSTIVDHVAFKEQEVSLLVKFNLFNEAKEVYKELLSLDSENCSYHAGLVKCIALSDDGQYLSSEIEELTDLYNSLGKLHNSSSAVKRIPLDFLQMEEFQHALGTYIRTFLHEDKRVPSLVSDLCPLYEHPGKAEIIDHVILGLESSIREMGTGEPIPIPLWTLLAQLYDRRGQHETALDKVDEAIRQNPAVADLYLLKGRILIHAGELETAASMAEKAMDMERDNNFTRKKYVKLMLQADMDVEFKKDGGDLRDSLCSTECMWYEIASGDSYFRRGDLERSLKNYLDVVKHYTRIVEDHFKFHSYHSREMSVRAYVETLKNRERLDPGLYFHKAVSGVVRCYIKLYDSSTKSRDETSKLLPSQKKMQESTASRVLDSKKLLDKKHRKQQGTKKTHIKEFDEKDEEETSASRASKLLQEATKYLKLLRKKFPDSFETHFLMFELTMRKQEILHAYEALNELLRLDRDNPDTLRCFVRFYGRLDSMVLEESVRQELATPLSTLCDNYLTMSIKDFLLQNKDSLMHRAAVAEMLFFLQPYKKFTIIELIEETSKLAPDIEKQWKLNDCIAVHELLKSVLGDAAAAARWQIQCSQLFPLSTYFSAMTNDDTSINTKECQVWIFDSGSTLHCTSNANLFSKTYSIRGSFFAASGNEVSYSEAGHVYVQSGSGIFKLLDVRLIPPAADIGNVVSVNQFATDETYLVQFFHDGFLLRDKSYLMLVSSEFIHATGPTVNNNKYKYFSKFPGKEEECSKWHLDSGANRHVTSDESLLDYSMGCHTDFFGNIDGTKSSSSKRGYCKLIYTSEDGTLRKFELKDVYVVDKGPTLLSVSAFTRDNKCSILFCRYHYYILDATDDRLLKPDLIRGYGMVTNGFYCLC